MYLIKSFRKTSIILSMVLFFLLLVLSLFFLIFYKTIETGSTDNKWHGVIDNILKTKDYGLLTGDKQYLSKAYALNTHSGGLAYDSEVLRAKYIKNWSAKQGVKFEKIVSNFKIEHVRRMYDGYSFDLIVSTEYQYYYLDSPQTINMFRTGTYHTLDLVSGASDWLISQDLYLDPFHDSRELSKLSSQKLYDYITTHPARDSLNIDEKRKSAVAYADRYCGAAANEQNNFEYNNKYPDFNNAGGDCSNFSSQVLHEGGGLKTNEEWNCAGSSCTAAWGIAQCLKDYLLRSGKATLLAEGFYRQVYKTAYELLPGDVIAYEEYGRIVHTGVVTGFDSKGYPLVNTHTTDRYHVPWELGWDDSNISYWLLRINY